MVSAIIIEIIFLQKVTLSTSYVVTDLSTDIDGNGLSVTARTDILSSEDIYGRNQNAGNHSIHLT